jgi:hypothetical protein
MIVFFFLPPKMENTRFRFMPSQELVLKSKPQAVKVAADGPPASGAQGPSVRTKKWEEVEERIEPASSPREVTPVQRWSS